MKLFARVLSLTLVAVMLCLCLAACGGVERIDNGEYIRGDKALNGYYDGYIFEEDTFTYGVYLGYVQDKALSYSGTYVLEIIENEDEETQAYNEENGIREGFITLTYTDAAGAPVESKLPIYIDDMQGILIIGDLQYNWFEN